MHYLKFMEGWATNTDEEGYVSSNPYDSRPQDAQREKQNTDI